jgi:hypothetical protein
MQSIYKRISVIKYQKLSRFFPTSDQVIVQAVQSIYDAAISTGDSKPADLVLPDSIMGVTIDWNQLGTSVQLRLNDIIVDDDFTDSYVPTVSADASQNYFKVNNDFFLVNGQILTLNV